MKEKLNLDIEQFIDMKKVEDYVSELNFESGLRLLEELVSKIESGSLPLERSMLAYERGTLLTKHLRELISGAEVKLKILQQKAS